MASDDVQFPLLELLPEVDKPGVLARLKMLKYDVGRVVYERLYVQSDS